MINKEGDVLCRGAISREDGSTGVARFVDLGEKIETGRFSISRREKFVGLLREMITFLLCCQVSIGSAGRNYK